jgi:hypothetical protein
MVLKKNLKTHTNILGITLDGGVSALLAEPALTCKRDIIVTSILKMGSQEDARGPLLVLHTNKYPSRQFSLLAVSYHLFSPFHITQ